MRQCLGKICDAEGVRIDTEVHPLRVGVEWGASGRLTRPVPQALSMLVEMANGDLRKAINLLQSAHRLRSKRSVTKDLIADVAGIVPMQVIEELFACCRANSFEQLEQAVQQAVLQGYSANQIVEQMMAYVCRNGTIKDSHKAAIALKAGQVDKCLSDGADEYLQLMDLLSATMTALRH